MAEVLKVKGTEYVVGFDLIKVRDVVLYFIGPQGESHPHDNRVPIGERFATKEMIHFWMFKRGMEKDPTMHAAQMKAVTTGLVAVEAWCHDHDYVYASFPLMDRGTGKIMHYYGITKNDKIISLVEKWVNLQKQQHLIACDRKLTMIEKADLRKKLTVDESSNLKEILAIVKADEKGAKKNGNGKKK